MTTTTSLAQLRRIRWAVRGALTLGVAASVAANTLHAQPNPVGRAIAAWPPLALLLTIELISRVPVHRRRLAVVRFAATAGIAGIAAWVSYWHMADVCARYGETLSSARLVPFSVDGLVVVASVCLVEIGGRIHSASANLSACAAKDAGTTADSGADTPADSVPPVDADTEPDSTPDTELASLPDLVPDMSGTPGRTVRRSRKSGRPDTARAVARLRDRYPDMSSADIARRLGVTDRTVRRHLQPVSENPSSASGAPVAA